MAIECPISPLLLLLNIARLQGFFQEVFIPTLCYRIAKRRSVPYMSQDAVRNGIFIIRAMAVLVTWSIFSLVLVQAQRGEKQESPLPLRSSGRTISLLLRLFMGSA